MTRFRPWVFPCAVLLLVPLGCDRGGEGATEVGATAGSNAAAAPPTNRVDIPATVRSNLGITFAKVERRSIANTIRVPGAFELQPLARHEYRLMLPGRIEFLVDQFDEVKPGTPIYRFRSPSWPQLQQEIVAAEQLIATARAQIEVAEAGLAETRTKYQAVEARIKALAEADFKRADLAAQVAELRANIPKQEAELQVARTTLTNAEQAYSLAIHRASAAVGLKPDDLLNRVTADDRAVPRYQTIDWIEVSATEPGMVESLAVTDGTFVEATTLLLTTVDPTKVRFRALGLQSDLPKFRSGQKVRIVLPRANGADVNQFMDAELTIGLSADPNQRTVTLFATPTEQQAWTRPGVSAFMEIAAESTGGGVLAIPRSAVVKDGITHVFFRRDPGDPNKAIRIEADLGVDDGRWIEIKSGLGPNDEVVLNGAYELKLATAMSGSTQKGGHFHADGSFHGEH